MTQSAHNLYPLHRPELLEQLRRGDAAIDALMAPTPLQFNAREALVVQGDGLGSVFRLLDGWCARVRTLQDARVQIISIYMPGDLMALKSMFVDEQVDGINALCAVEVAAAPQEQVRAAMTANADVAVRIGFALTDEERRLHNRVVRLGQGDATERVSAMLVALRARLIRTGRTDPKARAYRLPMTQVQISEFLGLTPVHVNRVFRRLREDGLATIGAGEVRLTDVEGLMRLATPVLDRFEREGAR